jgi:hypothetical protein
MGSSGVEKRLTPNVIGYLVLCVAAVLMLAPDRAHLLDHFPHHDEALAIFLGRAVWAGQACDGVCAQHTGSVFVHPALAALGDDWKGLYGARLVSVGCGLVLLAAVIATGWLLMGPTGGWLSGALLLVQAPFLYVSRMALYDVVAASFLGIGVAALVAADRYRMGSWAGAWLLLAALSLLGAGLAKYVAAMFLLVALVVVLWRFRVVHSLCFVLPVAVLGGLYLWEVAPLLADVMNQAHHVVARGQAGFARGDVAFMLLQWLRWPFVLAALAFVPLVRTRADGARPARSAGDGRPADPGRTLWVIMIAAALLVPLAHLATGAVQGLNKNVVLSLVVLAPVSAYGLLRLSRSFNLDRGVNVQWAVVTLVLTALAWGGLQQRTWLEHQYPDLSPAVAELRPLVTPQTVIMTDTDALLRYVLADRLRPDQVVLTYWTDVDGVGGEAGAQRFVAGQHADYVLLDGYYGQAEQHERLKLAMGDHYRLRRRWPMHLSWGERNVELYEREGVTE